MTVQAGARVVTPSKHTVMIMMNADGGPESLWALDGQKSIVWRTWWMDGSVVGFFPREEWKR